MCTATAPYSGASMIKPRHKSTATNRCSSMSRSQSRWHATSHPKCVFPELSHPCVITPIPVRKSNLSISFLLFQRTPVRQLRYVPKPRYGWYPAFLEYSNCYIYYFCFCDPTMYSMSFNIGPSYAFPEKRKTRETKTTAVQYGPANKKHLTWASLRTLQDLNHPLPRVSLVALISRWFIGIVHFTTILTRCARTFVWLVGALAEAGCISLVFHPQQLSVW